MNYLYYSHKIIVEYLIIKIKLCVIEKHKNENI